MRHRRPQTDTLVGLPLKRAEGEHVRERRQPCVCICWKHRGAWALSAQEGACGEEASGAEPLKVLASLPRPLEGAHGLGGMADLLHSPPERCGYAAA